VGLLLTKVPPEHVQSLFLPYFKVPTEPYQRGGAYDVIFCYNLHRELELIRKHTDARIFAIAPEPPNFWPNNYDPRLVNLCDRYLGYAPVRDAGFRGEFREYVYPCVLRADLARFDGSLANVRRYTFCIFARHDPNIRCQIAAAIKNHDAFLGGPLFGNPVPDKWNVQSQAKFEFITENEINDGYVSEKLGQALTAGCVPIYLGSPRAQQIFPANLFIRLDAFKSIQEVVAFCRTDGTHERYFDTISRNAKAVLERHHTWEGNIFDPFHEYVNTLEASGFRSRHTSFWWKLQRSRRSAGRIRKWVRGIAVGNAISRHADLGDPTHQESTLYGK
jgi:hypothetical protein